MHTKELEHKMHSLYNKIAAVPDVSVDVEGRNGHFDAFAVGRQKVEAHQKATYREKRVHNYESVQQNHCVQPLVVLQITFNIYN
jgi:hypothetical protein